MKTSRNKIWYASYGSNLQKDRFLCYIRGGQPKGRLGSHHDGCRDKTLPEEDGEFYIPSQLYFAQEASVWNSKGVGFISNQFDYSNRTLARKYLITKEQFIDVVKQEIDFKGNLEIDFDTCIRQGSLIFKDPAWYGNLLYLGAHKNIPIFTFTSKKDFTDKINPPDSTYLKTIIEGIKEVFSFNDLAICDYLIKLDGIDGNYSRGQLIELINKS